MELAVCYNYFKKKKEFKDYKIQIIKQKLLFNFFCYKKDNWLNYWFEKVRVPSRGLKIKFDFLIFFFFFNIYKEDSWVKNYLFDKDRVPY